MLQKYIKDDMREIIFSAAKLKMNFGGRGAIQFNRSFVENQLTILFDLFV